MIIMFTLRVQTKGFDTLDADLKKLIKEITNAAPLWEIVEARVRKFIKDEFNNELGYVGTKVVPWPWYYRTFADKDSADHYLDTKPSQNRFKLLRKKGQLRDALINHPTIRKTRQSFSYGIDRRYKSLKWSYLHNYRDQVPWHGKGPRGWRPFLRANSVLSDGIQKDIDKWTKSRIRVWRK